MSVDQKDITEIGFITTFLPQLTSLVEAKTAKTAEYIFSNFSENEMLEAFERTLIVSRAKIISPTPSTFLMKNDKGQNPMNEAFAKSFLRFLCGPKLKLVANGQALGV